MIYPYIKDGDFNMANCFLIPSGVPWHRGLPGLEGQLAWTVAQELLNFKSKVWRGSPGEGAGHWKNALNTTDDRRIGV